MKPENAIVCQPSANLCEVSLQDAAPQLNPSFEYTLRVGSQQAFSARRLLHAISADVRHNPFAPYINLEIEFTYNAAEWSLQDAAGTVYWSAGA